VDAFCLAPPQGRFLLWKLLYVSKPGKNEESQ